MDITIRFAQLSDSHDILVAKQQIATSLGLFCSQPQEFNEKKIQEDIAKFGNSDHGLYIVAEFNNKIIGHALVESLPLKMLSHVGQLSIGVHPGWQGKGVGFSLMQYLIRWAKKSQTIEKIELNVRATNQRAIALYKKMGFYEEGRLKKRVKMSSTEYIDDLLMAFFVK